MSLINVVNWLSSHQRKGGFLYSPLIWVGLVVILYTSK